MKITIGERFGRYRITGELARGGQGEVYVAEDPDLGRHVALKILPGHLAADPANLRRFAAEARALAAVNHPGIVTIHTVEEVDGVHFITMELLDGAPLSQQVRPGGLPPRELFDLALPLAAAVAAAHARGVVHRDLKPTNVIVTRDGTVKVLDFGLAKQASPVQVGTGDGPANEATTVTLDGDRLSGTPGYMAPEQAAGRPATAASDVFALGVILYELATGRRPFRGTTVAEILAAVLRDEPLAVCDVNTSCSAVLQETIATCLYKDPERRYRSAADLLTALKEAASAPLVETQRRSIAVLRFADMSRLRDQGYLCEGIAEEIMGALARLADLRVASRTSSFQFEAAGGDSREIGKALGVATLLEGSVRKAGDRLRVTAQLVDARTGYHLWSAHYERQVQDVFAIQDEIARAIAEALQVTFNGVGDGSAASPRTSDARAYDYYLRGRNFFLRWGKRNLEIAQRMFEQAIAADPGYARAHAGLADALSYLYMYINSSDAILAAADRASRRALELAPRLAEAHAARGLVLSLSHDFAGAESAFVRAIELQPDGFEAHYFRARSCVVQGKYEEAVRHYEVAAKLAPEDCQIPILAGQVYHALGRDEEALAANRRGLELAEKRICVNPEDVRAYYMGAGAMVRLGQVARGIEWAERALAIDPADPAILYNVSCTFAAGGRLDQAIDCLERSVQGGSSYRDWIENDSDLDPLRDHPRFRALLARL